MSATNRGDDRYDLDYYATGSWITHRFLDKFGAQLEGGDWLEPCAGDGAICRAVSEHVKLGARPIRWTLNEIQAPLVEDYPGSFSSLHTIKHIRAGDFLSSKGELMRVLAGRPAFDVAITNPPYNIALQVAMQLMTMARNVVLLLRVNFFGSKERHPWISQHVPYMTGVLPDRPSFRVSKKTGKVGTDATEYCWMWWKTPFLRDHGYICMLDRTDEKTLKADRQRIQALAPRRAPRVDENEVVVDDVAEKNVESHPRYQEFVDQLHSDLVK